MSQRSIQTMVEEIVRSMRIRAYRETRAEDKDSMFRTIQYQLDSRIMAKSAKYLNVEKIHQ